LSDSIKELMIELMNKGKFLFSQTSLS